MSKSKVLKEEQVSNSSAGHRFCDSRPKRRTKHEQRQLHHLRGTHRPVHIPPLCVPVIRWDASCGLKNPLSDKILLGSDPRQERQSGRPPHRRIRHAIPSTRQSRTSALRKNLVRPSNWRLNARCILPIWPSTRLSLQIRDGFYGR